MKFFPGDEANGRLDCYQVGDTDILNIVNENGDITAFVRRSDGTYGHAFGGPVYDPPEFMNTCSRRPCSVACTCVDDCVTCATVRERVRPYWLTDGELAMATALARKVGWL